MSIQFGQINANNRVPSVFSEINASKALTGAGILPKRALIIGQKVAAGTGAVDSIFQVASAEEVELLAGVGSHMADMYKYFAANNKTLETEILLLDEGTTAAEKTITVTGSATENGTIPLYVSDTRILIPVTSGDANTVVAAAIDAAINANKELLFTSTVAVGVVTAVANNKGEWTEKVNISKNRFPPERGGVDKDVAGITVVIASSVPGAGNVSLTTALAAVPDKVYNYILMPFNDSVSDASMLSFLIARQDANEQLEGHSFNSFNGTRAESTTHGNANNGEFQTTIQAGVGLGAITPEHGFAAAYIGQASKTAALDPLLPWTGQLMIGVIGDFSEDQLTLAERNILLFDGIATHTIDDAGNVRVERGITNFQKNALDQSDASFLDSQTLLGLSEIRQGFLFRMTSLFLNKKLASDPLIAAAGSNTITPLIIRGEIIALFSEFARDGLIEDLDEFLNTLIVIRDIEDGGSDPNRVNVSMSPDIVNQVRMIANNLLYQ